VLQDYLPIFREMGVEAFGIVAQRTEKVHTFMTDRALSLPILIDTDRVVMKLYGVHHRWGLDAWNVARPSTFLIDVYGRVRFVYVGERQSDRPDPQAIIAELRKLRD